MNCPKCQTRAYTMETRHADGKVIRRQWCKKCDYDFITVENYLEGEAGRILLREGRDNAKKGDEIESL